MSPVSLALWTSVGGLVLLVGGGWLAVRLPSAAARGVVKGILAVCFAPFVAVAVLAGLVMSALGRAVQWLRGRRAVRRLPDPLRGRQ